MKRYCLDDMVTELGANPQVAKRLFLYHASKGRYGPDAALAVRVPESARIYTEQFSFATARTAFEAERRDPTTNEVLMRSYLRTYSQERNQRNWNRGKKIAIGMGTAGLAFLAWSLIADAEGAKNVGKAAGAAFEVGAGVRLIRDYLMHKA